jgi:predicted metal-binding protein
MPHGIGTRDMLSSRALHPYMRGMAKNISPVVVKTRRADCVFVCRKCLDRIDHGGKVKPRLKAALAPAVAVPGQRRQKIVMTSCFGVCPRRAVVCASPETLGQGEVVLLADAKPSSIRRAAASLKRNRSLAT